jgi:hypothetical protein
MSELVIHRSLWITNYTAVIIGGMMLHEHNEPDTVSVRLVPGPSVYFGG